MERLTKQKIFDGSIELTPCDLCYMRDTKSCKGTNECWEMAMYNRLSAYEDTGLTPEQIKTLRNELCLKCGAYEMAHKGACDGCRWRNI